MHRLKIIAVVVSFALIVTGMMSWTALAGSEPQSSIEKIFQKAKRDYLQKNMNSAAEQIKKGAAYMKDEAAKASDKGREALAASEQELEKLAGDVKTGAVTSVKRINESFARAYLALASNAQIKSTEAWTKKEAEKTGDALDSAAGYLERSFNWAGQKIEGSTKNAVKKSKDISLKLKKKSSVIAEDVRKRLEDTGNEIEKFGKRIFPQ